MPLLQIVVRKRDNIICAFYVPGAIAADELIDLIKKLTNKDLPSESVYWQHWRKQKCRFWDGSRFVRCNKGDSGAFSVTGIDIKKWGR